MKNKISSPPHGGYDVVVVGAGIVGTSIAWRLSRTRLKVALIERGLDVANGSSRANSGIIHSGVHENPDSEMFHWCREGFQWYKTWSGRLDFPYRLRPTLIVAPCPADLPLVKGITEKHSSQLEIEWVSPQDIRRVEPLLNSSIAGAWKIHGSSQISPYEACRAIVENARDNGLSVFFDHPLLSAQRNKEGWSLRTPQRMIETRHVILAAGQSSTELSSLFGFSPPPLKLVEGFYFLMDRRWAGKTRHIIFGLPKYDTKGFLIQETVHGNLLLGPDSVSLGMRQDQGSSFPDWERLCNIWNEALLFVPTLDRRDIIRSYSGVRHVVTSGFHLENKLSENGVLLFHGIKSPGLTAAPALAGKAKDFLERLLGPLPERDGLNNNRISIQTRTQNSSSPSILCRCEKIREAEILEAFQRGITTLEGIRWSTRAGMGRCQGGFCRSRVIELMMSKLECKPHEIIHKEKGFPLIFEKLK